jgi:hypothetical protein
MVSRERAAGSVLGGEVNDYDPMILRKISPSGQ